jgi:hypothetical protein
MIVILANLEMRTAVLNHPAIPFQEFVSTLHNPKGNIFLLLLILVIGHADIDLNLHSRG